VPQHKPLKIPRKTADVIAREVIDAGHFPVPLKPRSKNVKCVRTQDPKPC
jgi:hypothetical protein